MLTSPRAMLSFRACTLKKTSSLIFFVMWKPRANQSHHVEQERRARINIRLSSHLASEVKGFKSSVSSLLLFARGKADWTFLNTLIITVLRVFSVGCRIRLNAAISKITSSPSISLSIVDYLIIMDSIEAGLTALRLKDESNIRATARKFDLIESILRRRYNRQIVSMKRARFLTHHRLFQIQKRVLIIQINRFIDRDIPSTTRMMRNFAKKMSRIS